MTEDEIDTRLRTLGIPDEYTARNGSEPLYVHVREDGQVRNWYATSPLGMLMLKSDVKVMRGLRPTSRFSIEVGRGT